jgi:hypothetical protein
MWKIKIINTKVKPKKLKNLLNIKLVKYIRPV